MPYRGKSVVDNILSVVSKRFGKEMNYFNKLKEKKKRLIKLVPEERKKNSVYFPTLTVDFRPYNTPGQMYSAYALRCSRALDASHQPPPQLLRSPLRQAPAEASGLNRGKPGRGSQ